MTYIYPLKLRGSSGKGILKITNVTSSYYDFVKEKVIISPQINVNDETNVIHFNLTTKEIFSRNKFGINDTNVRLSRLFH